MDRDELRVFCDLSGRRTDSEGTVPEELLSPDELLSLTPSRVANGAGSQGLKPNIMFLSRSFRYTITYYKNHLMCFSNLYISKKIDHSSSHVSFFRQIARTTCS